MDLLIILEISADSFKCRVDASFQRLNESSFFILGKSSKFAVEVNRHTLKCRLHFSCHGLISLNFF